MDGFELQTDELRQAIRALDRNSERWPRAVELESNPLHATECGGEQATADLLNELTAQIRSRTERNRISLNAVSSAYRATLNSYLEVDGRQSGPPGPET